MTMQEIHATKLAEGYSWPEAPRGRDDVFYFSDMYNQRVMQMAPGSEPTVFVDFSEVETLDGTDIVVIGTGFLPDGSLLAVSAFEKVIRRVDPDGTMSIHADLREVAGDFLLNDMVVDAQGRAYVSPLGFDLREFAGREHELIGSGAIRDTHLIFVEADGTASLQTEAGLTQGANGLAISADGTTLVAAEVFGGLVSAFEITADGSLRGRRVWATVDGGPDGLCMDDQDGVWVALPGGGRAERVLDGGEITHVVRVDPSVAGSSTACGLAGPGRSTLFLCCGFDSMNAEKSSREAKGSIWAADVPFTVGAARP